MSITEELRRYISGPAKSGISHICEKAIANIADRIDAEHERACAEAYGNGVESVALPDMTAYIQLPKDADGEYIRIGDEVEVIGYEDGTVAAMQLDERRWSVAVRPHGWDTPTAYDAESIRHAKPDSWERIIEDVRRRTSDYYCNQIPCDFRKMADEMVERCKRLAGEDA